MNFNEVSRLTESEARTYLEQIRWPTEKACPHCGCMNITKLENVKCGSRKRREGLYKCRDCRKQFTVTVGTIFEGSHVSIRTWLMAFALMCASKKGVSSCQVSRMLGVTQKTAWYICHRVRYAMGKEPLKGMLRGAVEVDETYVGGKPRKQNNVGYSHLGRWDNKTPVVALVERDGRVRTQVTANITGKNLKQFVLENVRKDSTIYSDEHQGYKGIGAYYQGGHKSVKHSAYEYARDDAHINTAECFFSLLKRGVVGAFHKVSKEHLQRYCDEFSWRWNLRKVNDEERTIRTLKQMEGKRLFYNEPLRKVG
jgi:transposase-like protein